MYIIQLKIGSWNDQEEFETLNEAKKEVLDMLNKGYTSNMLRIVKPIKMEVQSVHTVNVSEEE